MDLKSISRGLVCRSEEKHANKYMLLDFTYCFVNIPVFVNLLYKYSNEGLIWTSLYVLLRTNYLFQNTIRKVYLHKNTWLLGYFFKTKYFTQVY